MIVKNGAFWWNLTGLRPAVRSNRLTSLILMIMMIMMAIMVQIMMVMLLMMMLLLMLMMVMVMMIMMMMATGFAPRCAYKQADYLHSFRCFHSNVFKSFKV